MVLLVSLKYGLNCEFLRAPEDATDLMQARCGALCRLLMTYGDLPTTAVIALRDS